MIRKEWEEERAYCSSLVRDNGDRNVPRDSVASYLELQRASALREGHEDIAVALGLMLRLWEGKARKAAAHAE